MGIFEYNKNLTYTRNFENWYVMNCDERTTYHLSEYSKREARKVFSNQYKNKLAHSIKINADGVLEDILVVE